MQMSSHLSRQLFCYSEYHPTEFSRAKYDPDTSYYRSIYDDHAVSSDAFFHERFCTIYPVHKWAHDPFIRALLFSLLSGQDTLPSIDQVCAVFVLAKDLRLKTSNDIWDIIVPLLLTSAAQDFKSAHWGVVSRAWAPDIKSLSPFSRSMLLIIIDCTKPGIARAQNRDIDSAIDYYVRLFMHLWDTWILGVDEAWRLPNVGPAALEHQTNNLPRLNTSSCTCGVCSSVEDRLGKRNVRFRRLYWQLIEEAEERGCSALEEAWDPFLEEAESWLEYLCVRIQSSADILGAKRRLGPLIFDSANALRVAIGSNLSTRLLLLLLATIRSPVVYEPIKVLGDLREAAHLSKDYIGYLLISRGSDLDDEVLVGGDWLPKFDGGNLDEERSEAWMLSKVNNYDVKCRQLEHIVQLCMPTHPSLDLPWYLPQRHEDLLFEDIDQKELTTAPEDASAEIARVVFEVAYAPIEGFPLFSIKQGYSTSEWTQAVKLSTYFSGRLIETAWRPVVFHGRKCPHDDLWQVGNRCSMSTEDVLLQVLPVSEEFAKDLEEFKKEIPDCTKYGGKCWPDEGCCCSLNANHKEYMAARDHWQDKYRSFLLEEHNRRTKYLTERSGPFERHIATFIRYPITRQDLLHPLIILSASLGRKVYMLNYQECWDCAAGKMMSLGCGVGIAIENTSQAASKCRDCEGVVERAERINSRNR
ncbi:hypothetical protein SISNIDRAFT_547499 [Sistotremastrum niveocremeum HHB9708]|uniref:Uncharacterized protein n=1 Tax=Sistotremastrum niveocremeum HHB9708 TaxID=1314777 RepID=A0A164YB89_9AGAM|nr:hypothetical protein SISNIDRAFT_547499 [Sistotremastrum niveocremeum HHB9708]